MLSRNRTRAAIAATILAVTAPALAQSGHEAENIKLIKEYYAAYGQGEPEALRPFLHPEIVWRIPGRDPLAGDKRGPDEVIAFFSGLAKGKFKAEPIFFQAQGDLVVDIHRGWSNVGKPPEVDQVYALMFRIRDGKIIEAQNFLSDPAESDAFYWVHYPLKPLPDRLAED